MKVPGLSSVMQSNSVSSEIQCFVAPQSTIKESCLAVDECESSAVSEFDTLGCSGCGLNTLKNIRRK
eukprot:scaffold229020_cov31-Tisochrysis_lutea.AAC.3